MEEERWAQDAKPVKRRAGYTFAWLPILGLLFLLCNSCFALYRSRDDPWSIVFILVSIVDIVVLFCILRVFERTPPDFPLRRKLKASVWSLTTLLTLMFSFRIGTVVPPAIAMITWSMAVATILGGYYAFFVYQESNGGQIVGAGDAKNR